MSLITKIERLANLNRFHLSCGHVCAQSRAIRSTWALTVGDEYTCPVCFGASFLEGSDTLRLKLGQKAPQMERHRSSSVTIDPDQAPLRLRTADHPLANGGRPRSGERVTAFLLTLEDGRSLALEVGDASRAQIERTLLAIMRGFNTFQPDDQEDRR